MTLFFYKPCGPSTLLKSQLTCPQNRHVNRHGALEEELSANEEIDLST